MEIAALLLSDVETQRFNNDRGAIEKKLAEARTFLAKSQEEARGDVELNEIRIASARLALTPGAGRPQEARDLCDQVQRSCAARSAGRGVDSTSSPWPNSTAGLKPSSRATGDQAIPTRGAGAAGPDARPMRRRR